LLNFPTQEDDALLFIVSVQQDLCAAGDLQRRVPVPQQFAQEDFIAWFQDELVRFATAHGSSPLCFGLMAYLSIRGQIWQAIHCRI